MGHSNGVITAPVDIRRDVYTTLGISTYNGGYSLLYAITNPHGRINKWSKIKPVEIANEKFIHINTETIGMPHPFTGTYINVPAWLGRMYTESVRPGGSSADEILLVHIAGMGVPMLNDTGVSTDSIKEYTAKRIKKVVDNLQSWNVNWSYIAPVPPIYPARITDFNGYDHYALCPITYWVSEKVYNGESPAMSCSFISETNSSIDITNFTYFFPNYNIYAAIFKGESFRELIDIEPLSSGRGETATGRPIYTLSGANAGEYSVYFFATDGNRAIVFPTLTTQPNPQKFTAIKGNNPANDPFAGALEFDIYDTGTGFAHAHNSPYFESFYNVMEGDYVQLCTTAYYCVKARVKNNSSSARTFETSKFTAYWAESGRNPSIQVYTSSGSVASSITVPAYGSTDIYIEFIDIFLGMSPVQGVEYGYIDAMSVSYSGAEVLSFYCDVIYDTYHNGYFKKGDTYYKTK